MTHFLEHDDPMEFCPILLFFFFIFFLIPLISRAMRKRMSLPRTTVMIATEKSLKYDGTLEIQEEIITMCACLYIYAC